MIRHPQSGFCMELSQTNDREIVMAMCDPTNPYQKWSWRKRINTATVAY